MTSDDSGTEPDYRFTLANERTFLAWIRTSLGLLAGAVAMVQLVPQFGIPGGRHVVAAFLTVLAMLSAGLGLRRWQQVERAMRRGDPLPPERGPVILGVGLLLLGAAILIFVVVKTVVR
ncbi:MAG: YidH family protein [Candidatus Sericytochromatia bacterium]